MTTPTMFYRAFKDGADASRMVENEAGKWEWQIVEIEDGAGPPDGWHALPTQPATAPKVRKPKIEPVKDTDGHSDGN